MTGRKRLAQRVRSLAARTWARWGALDRGWRASVLGVGLVGLATFL